MATTSSCSHFLFNLCSSASSSLHRTNSFKRNQRSVFFRLVKLQILVVWNRLSQLYSAVDNNRLSSTPFSIRTSTWTGTWVHTGGEEVAGFTRCRGLAQGPSYDWLGDWDMSLSMISFTSSSVMSCKPMERKVGSLSSGSCLIFSLSPSDWKGP